MLQVPALCEEREEVSEAFSFNLAISYAGIRTSSSDQIIGYIHMPIQGRQRCGKRPPETTGIASMRRKSVPSVVEAI